MIDGALVALLAIAGLGLVALGIIGYWQFNPPDWWRW